MNAPSLPEREALAGLVERVTFHSPETGFCVLREHVRYWEIMATVRWAVSALQQAARHRSGAEPSLELDFLDLIDEVDVAERTP
jgi:hypothetical protein